MPFKRKSHTRSTAAKTRRRYKRKFTKSRKTTRPHATSMRGPLKLYGGFAPFPPTYSAKMHYVENFSLATGTAGVMGTSAKVSLNSLYDPNMSGSGHQPYGYDQITALYRRYIVSGVKINITFTNPNDDGLVVAVMIQASGGVGAIAGQTADIIKEQPLSWTHPINNTGSQVCHFRQYLPLQKVEGLMKVQWIANQDQYGALYTASPSLQPFLLMSVGSDAGSGAAAIMARIELTYYTRFYDRILQAYS
ncbi:capsid protein [Circovirus sp.]|nr:capsid protein [Circovirus sp.]